MSIRVEFKETGKADEILGKMPIELRGKILSKALRKAGNIVAREARRRIPKPGYAGDKPDEVALNKTVRVVIRQYGDTSVMLVGPSSQGGPHGHLVEYGHKVVLPKGRVSRSTTAKQIVEGRPFLRPAADMTESQQQRVIIDTLKQELAKLA